jgi:hypothetical protein
MRLLCQIFFMTFASSSAHAKKHARVRDVAAASSFATPGVYWNSPQPARWAVPASDAKYEFQVYVREITDYVDSTFPSARDEANDLPPTLATVTKTMGRDAVRSSSGVSLQSEPNVSSARPAKPCAQHPSRTSLAARIRYLLRSRTATHLPCGLRVAWP